MSEVFVFLLMVFCHIVDDYYLQGWLASAKQQEWWKRNAPQKLYHNDYKCALMMHGLSWSFMIMLPIAAMQSFRVGGEFAAFFYLNAYLHSTIDNLKANKRCINLWQDQFCHIIQIILTFMYFTR